MGVASSKEWREIYVLVVDVMVASVVDVVSSLVAVLK